MASQSGGLSRGDEEGEQNGGRRTRITSSLSPPTVIRHPQDLDECDVEEFSQEEPLTTRLNSILREGYKDGLSVPKELVQNADDAKATIVKILYDERENRENTTRLLNKGMAQCQGPALWFYNDAAFTEEDFANIRKLNGATKKNEVGKIGKFGLGFCSVYNLTDVPSFFSNQTFVFLDPHRKYLGEPGMKINLRTQKGKDRFTKCLDQFHPFQDVFGCSVSAEDDSFNGTLFRFPLRTKQQATISKIRQVAYTKEEVSKLLTMFIETAGDMMLFTQKIESIEIYHLGSNGQPGTDAVRIVSINKEAIINGTNAKSLQYASILQRMKTNMFQLISEIQIIHISMDIFDTAAHVISDVNNSNSNCTWIVSWSTGESKAMQIAKVEKDRKALPIAAVAVPCKDRDLQPCPMNQLPFGFHKSGRLFCFLPLPLECGLDMHINAYFDVTSDRRQLLSDSEDDKSTQSHQWNRALMTDAAVSAFLKLLVEVVETTFPESYYKLWPYTQPRLTCEFVDAFYKEIVSSNVNVFKGKGNARLSLSEVVFIDPMVMEDNTIGKLCFNLLERFPPRQEKQVIDIPVSVLRLFKKINETSKGSVVDDAIIYEEELILTFLNSIEDSFWKINSQVRNTFIVFSLKSYSSEVRQKLESIDCIPTRPNDKLRKPCELVKETCELAFLFKEEDERFLTKDPLFSHMADEIESLGMIVSKLSFNLLEDRCSYLLQIAESCCTCAYSFNLNLLQYLSRRDVQTDLNADKQTCMDIRGKHILPVLTRPETWNLPWYADDCCQVKTFSSFCRSHEYTRGQFKLAQPKIMYRQKLKNTVSCVGLVVDESDYKPKDGLADALNFLGVQSDVSFRAVVKQLRTVTSHYVRDTAEHEILFRSCIVDIYEKLWSALTSAYSEDVDEIKGELIGLSNSPVILIDGELLRPCTIAFKLKNVCPPYMYSLQNHYPFRHDLFQAFGVKECFKIDDVLKALEKERSKWLNKPCTDIDQISKLLQNLDDSMAMKECLFNDLQANRDAIIAPDETGILRPTSGLVVDDEDFTTSQTIHVLHPDIPRGLGERLGVKSKKKKCRANISRGIPFGQKEKLVTRLRGLLKAYPCDSVIMNELIQNADDAGATEICFITDFSTHKEDHRFGCKMLHQPALCVYNNSSFTEQDLQGIHDIGLGCKGEDPTKTGQYGVGFNTVYHLTDIPSFMTVGEDLSNGGAMCIFDPLCKYIEDVTEDEPGIRCHINGLKSDFPDILSGFHADKLLSSGVGTVFRFPLRQEESGISAEVITEQKMKDIIEQLKKDMFDALLFVKNVTCIKIMDVSSGQLKEQYVVRLHIPEEGRRQLNNFHSHISQLASKNKNCTFNNLQVPHREVQYKITVSDTRDDENWLIVQRFGLNKPVQDETQNHWAEEIGFHIKGLLPIGGVAIPLNEFEEMQELITRSALMGQVKTTVTRSQTKTVGRAFCFLPLPVKTDLPVHVNGHFALDHEARRELWKDASRKKWNDCILQHVVIPAWISGIISIQKMYVENLVPLLTAWDHLNIAMRLYHSLFPIVQTKGTYWANCVRFFYDTTITNTLSLFPFVQRSDVRNPQFSIVWCPLKSTESQFDGTFNGVESVSRRQSRFPFESDSEIRERKRKEHITTTTLKNIGMKLLETPLDIYNTITCLELKANISSTDYAMEYLRTFDKGTAGCCNIGCIDRPINESNYKTSDNLWHLVNFLRFDHAFSKKIDGLPVLLTAAGTLRQCSSDKPVLASKYQDLLPGSSDNFLHKDLLGLFPRPPEPSKAGKAKYGKEEEKTVVVKLTVNTFLKLLPKSCNESVYCSGRNVSWSVGSLVTPAWIRRVFLFLYDHDERNMQETLLKLGSWSFLPSLEHDKSKYLIPIERCYTLYKSTFQTKEDRALSKLRLPCLDTESLKGKTREEELVLRKVIKHIDDCCASIQNPQLVLKCLMYHKPRLSRTGIPCESATTLLSYFNRHLDILKKEYSSSLRDDMRSLPMFITIQKTIVSVDHYGDRTYVLPKVVPSQGIDEWASKENVVLLQESELFETLFKYLNLSVKDTWTFYVDILLPSLQAMSDKHWEVHVGVVRELFYNQSEIEQEKAKALLKGLPFVQSKKAKDYYHNEEPVFQCMLKRESFLPDKYRTNYWFTFLKDLGLQVSVDDTQFEDFARQIETYQNNLNEHVLEKSLLLVNNLINREKRSQEFLWRIRTIRFVTPYKVDASLSRLCPQHEDAAKLICFADSVDEELKRLCWTNAPLIHKSVVEKLSQENLKSLGVCQTQDMLTDIVTEHCRCVSLSFKRALKGDIISSQFLDSVQTQMELFYRYFSKHDIEINRLKHIPMIYLPQLREMVVPERIVVEIDDQDQMMPYLYMLPKQFYTYASLFRNLGSLEKLTPQKLSSILDEIHENYGDQEVIGSDFGVVTKVMSLFFDLLQSAEFDQNKCQIDQLFLPNRKNVLCSSSDIYIDDVPVFRSRYDLQCNVNWFMRLEELDIHIPNESDVFRKIPNHVRPILMSEKVTEEVCLDNIIIINQSEEAKCFESFLQSPDLFEGLIRLIRDHNQRQFTAECVDEIETKLASVKCVHVIGLPTVLRMDNTILGYAKSEKTCHVSSDGSSTPVTFWFRFDKARGTLSDVIKSESGLLQVVMECINNEAREALVLAILDFIEEPDKIKAYLDSWRIEPYKLCQSERPKCYPSPGTYLEDKIVPFLNHELRPFQQHEYKYAVMVFRPDESQDVTYKYVHIIKQTERPCVESNSSLFNQLYTVDCGDEVLHDVHIWSLYRLVKPDEEIDFGNTPKDDAEFKQCCHDVRNYLFNACKLEGAKKDKIIERLLDHWCHGLNQGNEYSKRIFHYICQELIELENGHEVSSRVDSETGMVVPDTRGTSIHNMCQSVQHDARLRVERYQSNRSQYQTYSHMNAHEAVRPDISEANRWLKQASIDYKAACKASETMTEVQADNWTCYKCLQACEKAMKAVLYSINANNVPNDGASHNLTRLAFSLSEDMQQEARLLMGRLGNQIKLRYPDVVNRNRIPSDVYNKEEADYAIEHTKIVIELAKVAISTSN